ncbi:PAS domain S-box protein, partial [Candidatus Riflebacteria bacterium]
MTFSDEDSDTKSFDPKQLKTGADFFQKLFENSPESMLVSDLEGKIIDCNQATLDIFGYNKIDVQKRGIEALIPKKLLGKFLDITKRNIHKGRVSFEGLSKKSSGIIFPTEFSANLFEQDGSSYVIAMIRDITEKKKIDRQLRTARIAAKKSTKLKDEFISLVAHDLKTPLTVINGYVQIVLAREDMPEDVNMIFNSITRIINGMFTLIDEVLNLARLQSGQITIKTGFFNIQTVIESANHLYAQLARQKKVNISNRISENTRFFGDKLLFQEV